MLDRKILLLVADFPPDPGGLANYSYNIANFLSKTNEVTVIALTQGLDISTSSTPFVVEYIPEKLNYLREVISRINELKVKRNLDVIYAITFRPEFSILGIYAKVCNIPFLIHGVGIDIYFLQPTQILARRIAYSVSDRIFCGAKFQKGIMVREGAPRKKIHVVIGGVDTEKYRPSVEKRSWFRKFFDVEDKFVLLTLGRLIRRKGFDDVIRSLTFLSDIKKLTLFIVGEGPEKPYLVKLSESLSLTEKVRFLGYAPSDWVPNLYNMADLFIAPFRIIRRDLEGFPLVLQEAQACATPVISTGTAGVPDLVENGKTGFLVPMNSPKKIAEKIRVLYEDRGLLRTMASNSRKRAVELLDWRNVIGKINSIFV